MKIHAAVWYFAEVEGNDWAKKYAHARKGLDDVERASRDSKWLRGRGGTRLRAAWEALSHETKTQLLEQTPDAGFPAQTMGVWDERSALKCNQSESMEKAPFESKCPRTLSNPVQPAQVSVPSASRSTTLSPDSVLSHLRARFNRDRSLYYDVVCREEQLKIATAYNNGNLSGVIEAIVSGVTSAVYLARSQDRCKTSDEAFSAVCVRVGDVLASTHSNTWYPPKPDYSSDAPSAEFSSGRITRVRQKYRSSLKELRDELVRTENADDPDPPLLSSHKFFGPQPEQ
jgi:hypothetical protein